MSSFQRLLQLPKRCTALYNNGSRRQYAQGAVSPEDLPMLLEQGKLKPFDAIPGPRAKFLHRILGSHSLYWPLIGKYSKTEQKETYTKFYHEFGPVVKEYVQPNYPIIHIYDPADMQVVFRNEGMYPARKSHLVLEKYRLSKPEYYNSGGVLPTNGPVWKHLRSNFQRNFTRPTDLSPYLQDIQEITEEFIAARIRPGIVEDCHQEISRLFLELTALVAFDERFNAFTEAELSPMSRSSQLMRSASTVNGCVMKTNNDLQLWDKIPWLSRTYRELVEAHKGVEKIALEQVSKKLAYMQNMAAKGIANNRTPRSLLEYYLTLTQVDIKDIMGMTVDLLLGGVDTVTSTTSFLLYHIARNPIEQEKVFEEACSLIPNKNTSMMDPETLDKAKRTRNAIRESFRLNPIAIGVGRILPVDVNLGGYHVPKGTHIVTQNQVACSLAKNFDDPDVFMPDRWDKRVYTVEDNMKVTRGAYHPFASIPFSHGARTCIARRLAEINMQTFLLRVLRRYKLIWAGDREVGIRTVLVHHPNKPIRVRFVARDN